MRTRQALLLRSEYLSLVAHFYLKELFQHHPFRKELLELFNELRRRGLQPPKLVRPFKAKNRWIERATRNAHPLLQQFLNHWPLPRLDGSNPPEVLLLLSYAYKERTGLLEPIGPGPVDSWVNPNPRIYPNAPLPFEWDPISEGREVLENRIKEILREVEHSIRAQAQAIEAEVLRQVKLAGPHAADPQVWGQVLFRRVVLRHSWRQIVQNLRVGDHAYLRRRTLELGRALDLPFQ